MQMEEALKAKKVLVIFSESDFKAIYDAVYNAKFPHQQAFIVPVLLDELDRVNKRSQKEAKEILDNIEQSDGKEKDATETVQRP